MGAANGFVNANIDVSFLDDAKVKRLWRKLGNSAAMSQALLLYLATVLSSWREGQRVTADDAAAIWMQDVESMTQALQAVGLLDSDGRIPEQSWENRVKPAQDRRESQREKWRNAQASARSQRGVSGESALLVRSGQVSTGLSVSPTAKRIPRPPKRNGGLKAPERVNEADLPAFLRAVNDG